MPSRIIVLVLLVFQVKKCVPDDCDLTQPLTQEGNLGQAGTYPWLGVIRVHLHEGAKLRIALTGSVLVKATHALAIANDVAKIPKKIFELDSKAMFIPYGDKPWLCRLKDYLLHPEYEYSTYNTIAIIELEPGDEEKVPMIPICWPDYLYNASNQLYVLGYTDEKQVLEKVIYKVQYVDKFLCEEYYNRAGLTDHRYTPTQYQCGLAGNNTKDCDWDNGMVLASNSSGNWVMIGFGIRGPGCSAPSRFIEIFQYLPWIETSTSNIQYPDYSYRKSAFGTGFKRQRMEKKERIKDIPVHQFFRSGDDGKEFPSSIKWFFSKYDEEHWKQYDITRLDKDAIAITTFKNKYEKNEGDCTTRLKYLCYTETVKIYAYPHSRGIVSYKLSLMDLMVNDYTCVTVRIESEVSTATYLWYNVSMNVDEPLATPDRTPEFILKKYPMPKYPDLNSKQSSTGEWKPHDNMEPRFIVDKTKSWQYKRNVNLFLQFTFELEAFLKLQIWGPAATTLPPVTTTARTLSPMAISDSATFRIIETITRIPRPTTTTTVEYENNSALYLHRAQTTEAAQEQIWKNISDILVESTSPAALDANDTSVEVARVQEVAPWKSNDSGLVLVNALCIVIAIYFSV